MKRSAPLQRRTPLRRDTPLKRTGSLKRRRRPESAPVKCARLHFNAIVTANPCFFVDFTEAGEPRRPGHVCDGELDAHHLVQKQWIKRYFGDLPEDDLLAILFMPIIGAPLCRSAHEAVTRRNAFIYFDELDDDLIDECRRIDERYAAPGRPSLLARLELECPKRESALAGSGRSQP